MKVVILTIAVNTIVRVVRIASDKKLRSEMEFNFAVCGIGIHSPFSVKNAETFRNIVTHLDSVLY